MGIDSAIFMGLSLLAVWGGFVFVHDYDLLSSFFFLGEHLSQS